MKASHGRVSISSEIQQIYVQSIYVPSMLVKLHSDAVLVKARVQIFCLAPCSNSLTIGRGTLPIGAKEGCGEMQIFLQNLYSILVICPQNKGVPICTT